MFKHNLKISFRNMRKYKNQTLISVIGLAVGFTCFALATLWIRYEMTFDSFHKNVGQMYVVYMPSSRSQTTYDRRTPNPLAAYLKETFPEIKDAVSLLPAYFGSRITVEGIEIQALTIRVDSSFFRMFDVKILDGNLDFLIPENKKIAITHEKARQFFGDENPIGKKVNDGREDLTVGAVVYGMIKQSNYPFDLIKPFDNFMISSMIRNPDIMWRISEYSTILELFPRTNIEAFEKKLYEHNTGAERGNISRMTLTPLTKIRYTDPNIEREVKFQHVLIFGLSGLLVIFCSLFNYLTLFVSRFRIRQKEFALRVVCGASGVSLLSMLSLEFIITLLFAVILGFFMTHLVYKPFLTLSDIQMNLSDIFIESFIYVGGVIVVSLLAFWLILFIFRQRNLNLSIRRSNKKMFRKISVVVQLVISIGFAFCTIIILKQMFFLQNSGELGFSFKNKGSLMVYEEINEEAARAGGISYGNTAEVLADKLRQIPEITDVVVPPGGLSSLLPQGGRNSREITSWDDMPADVESISLERMPVSPEYVAFYDFQLIAGEMLTDSDPATSILLNESAVKAFGWHDPVGKHFDNEGYKVKGVIKNVYNFAPTIQINPVFHVNQFAGITGITVFNDVSGNRVMRAGRIVLFKFHEGLWESCKEKVEQLKNEFVILNIYNTEEEYNKYLKSEKALIKLLSFVSAICVLICVFGFVSLVSLTCEERRKSIAIRKINGATAGDILAMFAKEYFLLLIIGAVIAFTTGYFIMQRWLENYAIRTNISAWIYLAIICVLALVIVLCVGWQVYKSSVENPAEVVKSE